MSNYESLSAAKILIELGESFLKKFGQSSYGFDRVYNDGTCIRLSASLEVLKYLEESKNMITAPVPNFLLDKEKFIYVVPDQIGEIKPEYVEFKNAMKINGVVNSIERRSGYYDQLWILSSEKFDSLSNICVNNIEEIQNFFLFFKDKAAQLVKTAANNSHYTLDPARISNIKGLDINKNSDRGRSLIQFSKREIECIAFMMIGLTIPEIGVAMSLSPRTVEYYINNLKSKLGCFRKSELLTQIKIMKLDSLHEAELKTITRNFLSRSERNQFD
jgi:DNA-binding CsgD family transcriptional regulator